MKKALYCEEHVQTLEVDLLGEPIPVDLSLSPVRGYALEIQTQIAERKKKRQTIGQKKRRHENVGSCSQEIEVEVVPQSLSVPPQPIVNRYDESHVPSWGIKTSDSVIGCDNIATKLFYKACTPYDQARASILS
ncbi:hypothetical protein Syun_012904 [Stephania yunnanensis]|uniref:Uncharacterized protein n=1 Tax=Stephania yunnanensis TaxID=152371 RepID=A0AAP0K140_9MAGN